jgi:YVTN family beta-propeller protein
MTRHVLKRFSCHAAFTIGFLLIGGATAGPQKEPPRSLVMNQVADYPLPGRATRWDYMSFDPLRSRLFIAHLGDSAVVVYDTDAKKVVGVIPDIGEVHGTLAVPNEGRIYATATKTDEVVAIDAATLHVLARIPTGKHPDGLAYAPEAHKLYVSDEYGKTETVVDAQANKRVATIQLGGDVGNTQYDPGSRHIFVNVQGTGELVEIDPASDAVVARIPIPEANGNHGLLIESDFRLAFIANEGNNRLLVMDLNTKKLVADFAVGKGPDVVAYDVALGIVYVASESGVVSEFQVTGQGVTKIGEGVVGANAHTVAVEPATHKVYFPLRDSRRPPVLRVMQPAFRDITGTVK